MRQLVTVAEITTHIRGLGVEVRLDHERVGLSEPCVVNGDGIHTIEQASLTGPLGEVAQSALAEICTAVSYAFGC